MLAKLLAALLLPATLLFGGPGDLDANDGPAPAPATQEEGGVAGGVSTRDQYKPEGVAGGVSTRDRYKPKSGVAGGVSTRDRQGGVAGGVSTRDRGPKH